MGVNSAMTTRAPQKKGRRETGKRRISRITRIMMVVLGRMKMGNYRGDRLTLPTWKKKLILKVQIQRVALA